MSDFHITVIGLLVIIAIFVGLIAWMMAQAHRAKIEQPDPADGYPVSRFGRTRGWEE